MIDSNLKYPDNSLDKEDFPVYYFKENKNKCFKIGIVHETIGNVDILECLSKFFNTKIRKFNENKRNYKIVSDNTFIKIVIIKEKDIPSFLLNGFIDSVAHHGSYLINNKIQSVSFNFCNSILKEKVIALTKKNVNFKDLRIINQKRKIIVMSSLESISLTWLSKRGLEGLVYKINDDSINYLLNDMCDIMIIACLDVDKILEEDVTLLENILETELRLHVKNSIFNDLFSLFQ